MQSDEYDFGFQDGCILLEDLVEKCLASSQSTDEFRDRFDQETKALCSRYRAGRALTLRGRLE
jgi:hypothetical protein